MKMKHTVNIVCGSVLSNGDAQVTLQVNTTARTVEEVRQRVQDALERWIGCPRILIPAIKMVKELPEIDRLLQAYTNALFASACDEINAKASGRGIEMRYQKSEAARTALRTAIAVLEVKADNRDKTRFQAQADVNDPPTAGQTSNSGITG